MMHVIRQWCERILPQKLFRVLFVHKYLHFFVTGVTGVGINLLVTWFFTRFVFGLEGYFSAYTIGIILNLLFNFTIHSVVTFKSKTHVFQRMLGFTAYSVSMTLFQAWIVKTITPIIGLHWYLAVIASVIFVFSIVTFLLFKFFLFKERSVDGYYFPQLLIFAIFSSLVLHVTGLLEVYFNLGLSPLVAGDGTGYVELAQNLWKGVGFVSLGIDGVLAPEVFRTPGLPLLLAPFTAFAHGLPVYLLLQTILSSILLPFLTYHIGRIIFSPKAGMIAAWFIALEPQMMFSSWSPLTETPFLIIVLSAILLFLSVQNWVGCRLCYFTRLALSGMLLGFAILVRPGAAILIWIFLFGAIFYWMIKRFRAQLYSALIVTLLAILMLVPWYVRTASLTGVYALSGTGWRNVFTDYVSSIRVVENQTEFSSERRKQKEFAKEYFGLASTDDINSPEFSEAYRALALEEIVKHPKTVFKLETLLLVSYFTNDNYYNQLIRLGFIQKVPDRRSPSQILLQEGLSGIPRIMEEMRKQYFVPVLSRLYQFFIVGLALWGLWKAPRRLGILFLAIIIVSAVTATVIGFGLEIRLRMPIMPILFLLVGHAIAVGLPIPVFIRRMKPHEN